MWYFVTPGLLLFAIVFSSINFEPISYDDYLYPIWANYLGLGLMMISLLPVPIFAIFKFIKYRKTVHGVGKTSCQLLQELTTPTEDWGPALKQYRKALSTHKRAAISKQENV